MAYHRHVKSIMESAAFDKDRMVAPKELWFDEKGLEEFYEARRQTNSVSES